MTDETNTSMPAPRDASQDVNIDTLYSNMRALDPSADGVGFHNLRVFYPGVGWDKIRNPMKRLIELGRVSEKTVLNAKGGVSHKLYTWKEV